MLSDALHLSSDPYVAGSGEGKGAKGAAKKEDAPAAVNPGVPGDANVSVTAIQLAIASRLAYQFRGGSGGGLQGVVPAVSGIGGGAAGAGAAGAAAGAPGAGGAGGAQGGAQGANAPASQIPGVVTVAPGYAGIATAGASGGISREWLLELARERNKVALPRVPASEWGVRLPSERFVLSGVGWGLKEGQLGDALAEDIGDDEDDEADGDVEMGNGGPSHSSRAPQAAAAAGGDHPMQDVEDDEDEDEDVEGGTMEDVFGQQQDTTMRDGDDAMDDATAANVKTERP